MDESYAFQQVEVELPFDGPDERGAFKLVGVTGVVNDPAGWVDASARVEATVTTDSGTVAHDEHEVLLRGGTLLRPVLRPEVQLTAEGTSRGRRRWARLA